MDLSVIMINFNTRRLAAQAAESVLRTVQDASFEIIVVDNSDQPTEFYSSDDSRIKVLERVENNGFGHACNLGAEKAEGEYLLFLNSDTIVHENALDSSLRYMREHPDIGILGIRTLLADGSFDHGCKRGFPTPSASFYYFLGMDKRHPESRKYGAYRQTFLPEDKTVETDCVSGAFLMMKKALFTEIGGFDEDYFMYGEDIDLCYRVKQAGHKVVYFAGGSITHLKGASGLHTKSRKVIDCFYDSMKIFYRKHYRGKYNLFLNAAVYMGINLKHRLTVLKMNRNG